MKITISTDSITYGDYGWGRDVIVKIERTEDKGIRITINAPNSLWYKEARIRLHMHEAKAIAKGLQDVVEGITIEETLKIPSTPPPETKSPPIDDHVVK